ncbi:MAG: hypothetical protein ACOC53_08515 [Candidatus Saliniplasma sp.]
MNAQKLLATVFICILFIYLLDTVVHSTLAAILAVAAIFGTLKLVIRVPIPFLG